MVLPNDISIRRKHSEELDLPVLGENIEEDIIDFHILVIQLAYGIEREWLEDEDRTLLTQEYGVAGLYLQSAFLQVRELVLADDKVFYGVRLVPAPASESIDLEAEFVEK